MAFQTRGFQSNAFQVIARVKAKYDYKELQKERADDDVDTKKRRKRVWLQTLADEAFAKQLDQLQQDELDFLDLLVVMLAEES